VCESRYVEGHHIKHRGAFFLSPKPKPIDADLGKAVHFRERLCFSTVDRYFDSPFSRSKNFVIAANPAQVYLCVL
jgi:hypothetical protein